MSDHPTEFQGDILQTIRDSIVERLPDAVVEAAGSGGHFTIAVTSKEFAGKGPVDAQRLVYGAITHLMKGHLAPIHAVDSLKTKVP